MDIVDKELLMFSSSFLDRLFVSLSYNSPPAPKGYAYLGSARFLRGRIKRMREVARAASISHEAPGLKVELNLRGRQEILRMMKRLSTLRLLKMIHGPGSKLMAMVSPMSLRHLA
jgi:hypothetical protein